jgi:hypothetical protein
MLREHRATLLWIARRWSATADDAEDPLQRALEIYRRRLDTVDAATELAWLKVVMLRTICPQEPRAGGRASLSTHVAGGGLSVPRP